MNTLLFYPMFALFCLTVIVLLTMFIVRVRAVRSGSVNVGYFKTYNVGEPPRNIVQTQRHFSNLFEAPVLFYVGCLAAMILNVQSQALLTFAWLYVAARAVHAWVHIGSNKLIPRMTSYGFGWLMLAGIWVSVFIGLQNV